MIAWRTRYALKHAPPDCLCRAPRYLALAKNIGTLLTRAKPDGVSSFYTILIIHNDSTGAAVSDSAAIAGYLDKTYPSSGPVLIPTGTMILQLLQSHF
ncbi:hypothetical protein ARMGADRAFT_1082319 [Armillaria gallica]|uniref:GST N-terminal domain-containing protein n=1 Tax=Armillaria gallica TaxID=47427 RepID=A0A2H3D790_ARMGA|nr:hypothetical protein ARMGADRAFT_1082319 [Armillaria gallica]